MTICDRQMAGMHFGIAALLTGIAIVSPVAASAQSSPSAFTSATRYDREHRVTGTIAPDPDESGPLHYLAVRNSYDVAGRLVRVEKGELASWQSEAVAPADWASFTTFTIQQTVDIVYDALDRKIQESISFGGTVYKATQYSYDPVGRLQCTAVRMNPALFTGLPTVRFPGLPDACTPGTAGTQGPDRITKNVYDDAGQLLQVRKAVGTSIEQAYVSYTYTDNGKQEYVTDANGNKARYIYDGFDRLYQWNFPDKLAAGTTSASDYEAYQYDANGNRTYLRKRDGTVFTYTYDTLDRMTAKIAPSGTRSVFYDYDAQGRQTAARFDSASGADAVTSAYDGFGRQTSSTTSMGGVSRTLGYMYDADGNRIRVTHPDGNYFTYDYDGLDRPVAVRENGGAAVVSMSWDTLGRRAGEVRGAVATTYGYDAISRLNVLADNLAGTAQDVTTLFDYNPANQITNRTRTNTAYSFTGYVNVNRSYASNGLNQYASVGGTAYGYDSNGNLTSDGSISFAYDAENRLVASSAGAGLTYDPLGRLYQTYKASTGATQFLYDGDQLAVEYDGSGTLLRRYVHGTGEDDPLLWYEGSGLGNRRSMQIDHQGSIVSIADASGTATAIYNYDEYGIPGATTYASRFQYTGQAWIPELGMYYYKARIYSPTLGRFMQADPIGYGDQQNLYTYVANDPMNRKDSTGLYNCSKKDCKTIARAIRLINKSAARWDKKGGGSSKEGSALRSFVNSLGTENDGNDVDIANKTLPDGTLGQESRDGSRFKIDLDFRQNAQMGNLSSTLLHETIHYLDDKAGRIYDAPSVFSSEYRAYFWGAVTASGYGWTLPGNPNFGGAGTAGQFVGDLRKAAHRSCVTADATAFTQTGAFLSGACP